MISHRLRWAALGLVLGCWGCGKALTLPMQPTSTANLSLAETFPEEVKREPEGPPRQPKPATCVAFAVLQEQTAATRQSAAERTTCLENARRAYQHALKLDPNHLPAYKGLARLYDTLEDHEQAVNMYHRALRVEPQDHDTWYLLGMSHARCKEWPAALHGLQKALELDPENRRYLNDNGFCLARAGRYQDAFAVLKKASGEAQAHYNLARMLEHLGLTEPCKEHLRLALQLKPEMETARHMLQRLESAAQPGQLGVPSPATGVVPVSHHVPVEALR